MMVAVLALLACTSPRGSDGASSGADGGAADDTAGDTGSSGVPDPSVYDCRAERVPDRVNPIDPACMVDRTCKTRLVSGHRGMGGTFGAVAPENTVSAVRAAIAYGVDYVETDPRPTADGVLVNVHDTTVDRTTDGEGTVSEMTLAEVQALHIEAGDLPGDFSCERIPTFREILETARGRVHVLVDANKTDRVDLLVADIVETDSVDWAIFDTSSVDKIDQALAIEPDLYTMIRVDTEEQLDEQLAHFADHPPVIVEIDDTTPELAEPVLAAGHRPLRDIFVQDLIVVGAEDYAEYDAAFAEGMLIAQSERPELVLDYLGR
ncbi:MAG: hypothetical protein D6798_00560 [Deltaproteobacteria bacterium]|nr:MAG: hypothetical protein D6798_00560 [Deltaproteobacteria bacterium]